MSDRPEIPQDLLRDMERYIREMARAAGHVSACRITKQLNALEQPADPAEVGATAWTKCPGGSCGGSKNQNTIEHISFHTRQAYAEREKAVKEMSDLVDRGRCYLSFANARVRRLFNFDKETP